MVLVGWESDTLLNARVTALMAKLDKEEQGFVTRERFLANCDLALLVDDGGGGGDGDGDGGETPVRNSRRSSMLEMSARRSSFRGASATSRAAPHCTAPSATSRTAPSV